MEKGSVLDVTLFGFDLEFDLLRYSVRTPSFAILCMNAQKYFFDCSEVVDD